MNKTLDLAFDRLSDSQKQLEQALDKLRPCLPSTDLDIAANQLLAALREPLSAEELEEATKDLRSKPEKEDKRPYYRKIENRRRRE